MAMTEAEPERQGAWAWACWMDIVEGVHDAGRVVGAKVTRAGCARQEYGPVC